MEKNIAPGTILEDVFRPVAVVHVEVEDRNTFRAGGEGFEHGDGDVVQVTKAHGAIPHRMMSRRAHEAEHGFAVARAAQRFQRRSRGRAGETGNAGMVGRVGVEVLRNVEPGETFGGVRAQDGGVRRRRGCGPGDRQIGLLPQPLLRPQHPGWFLRVTGRGVAAAHVVCDHFHCRTENSDGADIFKKWKNDRDRRDRRDELRESRTLRYDVRLGVGRLVPPNELDQDPKRALHGNCRLLAGGPGSRVVGWATLMRLLFRFCGVSFVLMTLQAQAVSTDVNSEGEWGKSGKSSLQGILDARGNQPGAGYVSVTTDQVDSSRDAVWQSAGTFQRIHHDRTGRFGGEEFLRDL